MTKTTNQPRVSIKDIAKAAGVSHSTVSRALRDSPLISEATRARVQSLAATMGYIPDAIAQSLQTQRTGTVGLVVTSIADPFFADLIEGVEEVAALGGMSVFVSASHVDPEREIEIIEQFDSRRVDGIIAASSRLGNRYTERLARVQVPVVLINKHVEDNHTFIHSISVDDQAGAKMAAHHLLDLGHRRIGYIGLSDRLLSNHNRHAGYLDALQDAGITPDSAWTIIAPSNVGTDQPKTSPISHDVAMGRDLFHTLWDVGLTALCCYNDRVAMGVLMASREAGVAVPHRCSVVGFDNIEFSQYVTPPLTTVHQPKREMGRRAMQMVLDLLDGKSVENQILSPTLIQRGSSSPPKGIHG